MNYHCFWSGNIQTLPIQAEKVKSGINRWPSGYIFQKFLAALLHTNQAAFDPRWLHLGYSKKAAASLNYASRCCHHSNLSKGKDRNQSGTDRYGRSLFTAQHVMLRGGVRWLNSVMKAEVWWNVWLETVVRREETAQHSSAGKHSPFAEISSFYQLSLQRQRLIHNWVVGIICHL